MFVVVVVAVLVIFAYFGGLFGLVGGPQKNVDISGVLSANNGGGPTATIAFDVVNLSSTPMVNASLNCEASQFAVGTCNGFVLDVNGIPLSAQNPADNRVSASGTVVVSAPQGGGFVAGDSYTVILTVSFSDGSSQSYSELLVAQA